MSFQRDFLSKKISDPLAKIVSDLAKQEYQQNFQVQNVDTITAQVLSIKTKTKTLSKDKFHVSVKSYDPNQRFFNAVYPDRKKLKLWLKGENSDRLHDYSLTNHNAHLWSAYQVAEQYTRDDENNMAGHEIVSHANGTHYVHVQDRDDLRICDLIVDEPSNNGFTILLRYNPLTKADSNQESIVLSQKVDSSQNRYGHSINVDDKGDIYFYVKYNYRQYYVKLKSPIILPITYTQYAGDNYKKENYMTEDLTIQKTLEDLYDLVCQFNYSTKECLIKIYYNSELIATASSLTGDTAIPPNCQLHLPLQEGKWSETQALPNNVPLNQVYDASSNQFIGTINNPDSATWQENNTWKNTRLASGGAYLSVPNHANLDAFTELTISFFAKFDDLTSDAVFRTLFTKGWGANGGIIIYRNTNTSTISCEFRTDANVRPSCVFTNAVQDTDHYYHIVMRWKTGEKLKLMIDGVEIQSSITASGTITSNSSLLVNGTSTAADNITIINFMMWKRQLTNAEVDVVADFGEHLMQLPKNLEPQRLPNPTPPPVTNPISTIYDLPKLGSPTLTDYTFINNPSAQNPFVINYNCPDGVAGGIPVSTVYNIAPGSGGTSQNPFTTIYSLAPANSTGILDAVQNEWAYGQYITNSASDLFGQKVSEITLYLKTPSGDSEATGGTVYLGVIKSNADSGVPTSYIKFGAGIAVSALPNDWTSYTRQLLTNTYVMALNDAVGVIWEGGTGGEINIQRGGSSHYEAESRQNHADENGWGSVNTNFSMAGTIKKGGDTVGTSPYYQIKNVSGSNYIVSELFPTNSPMVGEKLTRVEFRIYRDSAANNGTVSIRHIKTDGTYYPTLFEVNVSTLPNETAIPTTFNFVWENLDYNNPILAGERVGVVTNGLTTGNVYVLSNVGNTSGNSYDGTRSYLSYRNFNGTWGTGSTAYDVSGVMKKGGNTFTAYQRFSSTVTRIYERCININSLFYDQPLTRIVVRGRRVGTIPSPSTITARLRNSANVEKLVFGTLDANSIGTTLGDITFTNPSNSTIKVAANDYVSIEIATCDATNYIELNITNVAYNGTNSLFGTLTSGVIGDQAAFDLAGRFYTGGQIDSVSRKRVSQYIDTQDSIFLTVPNNRITIFEATLVAVGAPTGTIFINIRRGFDDALIFNLGQVAAGGITTALTGTTIHIENFLNTYILSAKDKISIEFEGGDASNKIGVQIRTVVPDYDGANSYIARYNGIEYDYLNTKDMVATIKVGGDQYQPEANAPPPVLPQNPTDWYILSDINKRENSFMRCIFGMYLFWNTLLTNDELYQFNHTRIDTGNNNPHEIQVTNHSFFRNS